MLIFIKTCSSSCRFVVLVFSCNSKVVEVVAVIKRQIFFFNFLKRQHYFNIIVRFFSAVSLSLYLNVVSACPPQSMAVPAHSSYVWMLVLGACVSLVVGNDCGKECALCVYRLLGQQSGFSSLVMSLLFIMIKFIYCFFFFFSLHT